MPRFTEYQLSVLEGHQETFAMDRYHLSTDGQESGPYTAAQVVSMWDQGQANMDTLIREDGEEEWRALRFVVGGLRTPEMVVTEGADVAALVTDPKEQRRILSLRSLDALAAIISFISIAAALIPVFGPLMWAVGVLPCLIILVIGAIMIVKRAVLSGICWIGVAVVALPVALIFIPLLVNRGR